MFHTTEGGQIGFIVEYELEKPPENEKVEMIDHDSQVIEENLFVSSANYFPVKGSFTVINNKEGCT